MIPTKLLLIDDEEAFVKPLGVDSETLTGKRGRLSTDRLTIRNKLPLAEHYSAVFW